MDEQDTRTVLDALARAVPDGVVLWRGASLSGGDVDLVVAPGREHVLARTLRDAGLSPAPQEPGRILWRRWPGETVILDVLAGYAWPTMYPPLDAVLEASRVGPDGWRVASAGDRLLIFAAEAVAGWPAGKVARRLGAVLAEPGARESLAERTGDGDHTLASFAVAPTGLTGDRLPMRTAVRLAARSSRARAALRERLVWRAEVALPPAPRAESPGLLLALSGMDGAGKSTAALALLEALEQARRPALVYWMRLAADLGALGRLAQVVRRALGRSEPLSALAPQAEPDPVADLPPAPAIAPAEAPSALRGLVDTVWVLAVAAVSVRQARSAARLRERGVDVVCDRWLTDTLIDLRLRYGHRPQAERLLRRGFPKADLTILLDVDATTAAARKPGDQTPQSLAAMAELYPALARELGLAVVDAAGERAQVEAAVRGLVESTLERAERRPAPRDVPGRGL